MTIGHLIIIAPNPYGVCLIRTPPAWGFLWDSLVITVRHRFFPAVILTLSQHAHLLAFPQSTFLAFPPHVHVHLTVSSTLTFVNSILCDASSEEA